MTRRNRNTLAIGLGAITLLAAALLLLRKKPAAFEPELVNKAAAEGGAVTQFIKVKLFYPSDASPVMRPVFREIEVPEVREELYRRFISFLLAGDEKRVTPVPNGAQLRSLFYLGSREMLVLDFNELLGSAFPAGTDAELEFIYFMVDNLCYNFREIKKVKFLIGGNESKSLSGHVDLERPFFPDFTRLKDE